MTINYTEFYYKLDATDMDDYRALQSVLKEARTLGLPVRCKLNAKKNTMVEAALSLLDRLLLHLLLDDNGEYEPVAEPKTRKQRFLEACNSAPRPGSLEQRPDERIDSLVKDEPGAGYDSHAYVTVDVEAVEVEDTDVLAVYLMAAAWAVGALALAMVVATIFVAKLAFTGLVAGVRAYHDVCFNIGAKWYEYESLAVRVPAIG